MVLQTNGVLLHRHDLSTMYDMKLTHLSLSINSSNEKAFSLLRGGAKFERITRNMIEFRESCPSVMVQFITTVTNVNFDQIEG